MHRVVSFIALLFIAPTIGDAAEPMTEKEWTVDGVVRQGLVYAPTSAKKSPTPVVFAFHGHGGNMNQAARSFGFHSEWPEAIVVYLQGLKTPGKLTDPEGKRPGWQSGRGDQDDRDLKFFDAVVASLKSDYKVDEKRIYATGHSNGGGFTYLLWATRGDVFAAVAPCAAIPSFESRNLKPKPALHLASETDPLVKWDWQKKAIDLVLKINGCDAEGSPWHKSGDLTGTIYSSKNGTPFVTLIHPGGHKFPSEAPALITKFFKYHPVK